MEQTCKQMADRPIYRNGQPDTQTINKTNKQAKMPIEQSTNQGVKASMKQSINETTMSSNDL